MYVVKTSSRDGGQHFKAFEKIMAVNRFWKRFESKAKKKLVSSNGESALIMIELYEVDAQTGVAAVGAVKVGIGDQIRKIILHPPQYLLDKVSKAADHLIAAALKKAQIVIDECGKRFPAWAMEDIGHLEQCLESLDKDGEDPEKLSEIFDIGYRLRGRGGTFGYPLITEIAEHLCNMIQGLDYYNGKVRAGIQAHIDSIKIVIANKVAGDDNPEFRDNLILGLTAVSNKISEQKRQ